jgi:hypothetical protein
VKQVITIICVFITLLQGGFSDAVWALCGAASAVFLIFKAKRSPPVPVVLILLSMVAVYTAAAISHGAAYESLSAICRLLVAGLLLFVFCNTEADAYETVCITGFVVAVIGYAAFCGVIHWDGAVVARRLQSVFQYANATALFLGVSAFMTRHHPKRAALAPFLETAMLLTQSVGALLVYAVGWIIRLSSHKETKAAPLLCGAGLSLAAAGLTIALVTYLPVPYIGILPPAALFLFRHKLHRGAEALSARKWVVPAGAASCATVILLLFYTRGLRPLATYLERLIQISDGIGVMLRHPLGIGPGAWQFDVLSYQSAPYSAAKIHSEYVAVGAAAGGLAAALLLLLCVLWFKIQVLTDKSICVMMILLGATMDIPFSFLSIMLITAMLFAQTVPKPVAIKPPMRAVLLLPLALCVVVFAQSAVKNRAEWTMQPQMLENLPVRHDTEAILSRMTMALRAGQHDKLDSAFTALPRPVAAAYSLKAQSHMLRSEYEEAAANALLCIEASPYQEEGYRLLEQVMPYLSVESRHVYREKAMLCKTGNQINPLHTYIQKIIGGNKNEEAQ